MKEIRTNHGHRILVDDEVYEWAKDMRWWLRNGYPSRSCSETGSERYLHLEVMGFPCWLVHHVDGDPLNCQRENLCLVSPAEHAHLHQRGAVVRERLESHPGWGKSGYKGVSWHKHQERWSAQISREGKPYQIGFFATAEEAAVAYDAAVIAFRGGRGWKNLISD